MRFFFIFILLVLGAANSFAQPCPQFLDESGVPANNPVFLLCSKDPRTLFIDFSRNLGSYTINWGDGSSNTTGGAYTAGSLLSHTYGSGVNNYTITLTTGGCVVTATVIKEEPVTASIQVPFGGVTRACAPAVLQFINSSTNNSVNTTYIWNFGDGSPQETYNSTNNGQTINHTYQRGTVDCGTTVTLTAYNRCNIRQGSVSVAEYSPILIWDLDRPSIASDTLFCYPDTVVTYTNATDLNCNQPGEGNVEQRTEYWRFIDYFGPGSDSIIDWRPFGPPRTIRYPGIGTYRVELRERSYCGEVSIIKTIRIIAAPVAGITADKDTICIGEQVVFRNTSTGAANIFSWNAEDGSGWKPFTGSIQAMSYTQPGTYWVKLAINVNGGSQSCKDTAMVRVVVVPDPVARFTLSGNNGCDSLRVSFTNQSTGAVSWNWTFGNGQSSASQSPPPQFYGAPGAYPVSLRVVSHQNCINTFRDTIQVFASPKVSFTATDVCERSRLQVDNTTQEDPADPVITWHWDWGDGQTSSTEEPSHTFNTAGNYNIALVAATPHCSGSATRPIVVHSLPDAVFTPDKLTGCSPLPVIFSNTTAAATFSWNFDDGTTSTQRSPAHTFVNTGAATRVFKVRLIAATDKGCLDTAYRDITVHPEVQADFTFTAENRCVSLFVTFVNTSNGGSAYQWDFGDGSASTAISPTHNYVNSGSFVTEYVVRMVATSVNGCKDTVIRQVSVNPEARFGFTADPDSGCSPLVVNFTAKAGAASYDWEFPDGTQPSGTYVQKTFTNNTNQELKYKVKLTAKTSTGCLDVTEKEIVVFPNPVAAVTSVPAQGCAPLPVTLNNNSTGAQTYSWDYGDGTGSTELSAAHTYIFPNTSPGPLDYRVVLTAISPFGCTDTQLTVVRVFPMVYAQFDTAVSGCSPLTRTFTATGGNSYQWNFGNGEISTNAVYTPTFLNSDNLVSRFYDVTLIARSVLGCTDTVVGRVEVFPVPLANFNPDKTQGCPPLDITFLNQSAGASSYRWDYGDGNGSVDGDASHNYAFTNPYSSPRDYTVTLYAENLRGCRDTAKQVINVFPDVRAIFVHDTIGCDPLPVKFYNGSQGAVNYFWDLAAYGTSNLAEPQQTFQNSGSGNKTYDIRLIAYSSFNCSDTASSTVTVLPRPDASFTLDKDRGCQPLPVQIRNTSTGATSYHWQYGFGGESGSNSEYQQWTYPNNADTIVRYTLTLIAMNNQACGDTVSRLIEVYPKVRAYFDSIQPGCSPLAVDLVNRSSGHAFITWNFYNEGGNSDDLTSHTFVNSSPVDESRWVQLAAQNTFGCADTLVRSFQVFAVPEAKFLVTPAEQRFPNATVSFTNLTAGNWNYQWDLGNNDVVTNPVPPDKTFSTWGQYQVTLHASNIHCWDTSSQVVTIIPPYPITQFDGGGEGCKPFTVPFVNNTQYGVSYVWDFGDGGTSTQKEPIYTYFQPGIYTVTLTAVGPNGESDVEVKTQIVKVNDNAEAFFTYTPEQAASETEPVDFLNLSKRADRYFWDFGDGTTSEEENPTHFYSRAGVFDIWLIADNYESCPDTFYVKNAITIVEGGNIKLPTAFSPNTAGPSGGRYDAASLDNDVFFPFHKEVEAFKMEIFNRWGEKIFETNDINIGWDGYFNGVICQQDVYVYKVDAVFKGGTKYSKVGDITLLR